MDRTKRGTKRGKRGKREDEAIRWHTRRARGQGIESVWMNGGSVAAGDGGGGF